MCWKVLQCDCDLDLWPRCASFRGSMSNSWWFASPRSIIPLLLDVNIGSAHSFTALVSWFPLGPLDQTTVLRQTHIIQVNGWMNHALSVFPMRLPTWPRRCRVKAHPKGRPGRRRRSSRDQNEMIGTVTGQAAPGWPLKIFVNEQIPLYGMWSAHGLVVFDSQPLSQPYSNMVMSTLLTTGYSI